MKLENFDYNMPESLVAQYPSEDREESRLMGLIKEDRVVKHSKFKDIKNYLEPNDILVINKSKVIPARLFGKRKTGGGVEMLLLSLPQGKRVKVLTRSNAGLKEGEKLIFNDGRLEGRIYYTDNKIREFEFCIDEKKKILKVVKEIGNIPLPPYIDRRSEASDIQDYQTVYAEEEGSIASPTAGLHFTSTLLQDIKNMGVTIAEVILHISYATFSPVEEENIEDHKMYQEYFEFPEETAEIIRGAYREKRRIISIGTTSCRVLETVGKEINRACDIKPQSGWTDLFIYPPYEFKLTNGLVTNFHLPRSTLLMLVCAFAGKDFILGAYEEAIEKKYRFYSYGDCMVIL